jgi:hypothetical protein
MVRKPNNTNCVVNEKEGDCLVAFPTGGKIAVNRSAEEEISDEEKVEGIVRKGLENLYFKELSYDCYGIFFVTCQRPSFRSLLNACPWENSDSSLHKTGSFSSPGADSHRSWRC